MHNTQSQYTFWYEDGSMSTPPPSHQLFTRENLVERLDQLQLADATRENILDRFNLEIHPACNTTHDLARLTALLEQSRRCLARYRQALTDLANGDDSDHRQTITEFQNGDDDLHGEIVSVGDSEEGDFAELVRLRNADESPVRYVSKYTYDDFSHVITEHRQIVRSIRRGVDEEIVDAYVRHFIGIAARHKLHSDESNGDESNGDGSKSPKPR